MIEEHLMVQSPKLGLSGTVSHWIERRIRTAKSIINAYLNDGETVCNGLSHKAIRRSHNLVVRASPQPTFPDISLAIVQSMALRTAVYIYHDRQLGAGACTSRTSNIKMETVFGDAGNVRQREGDVRRA